MLRMFALVFFLGSCYATVPERKDLVIILDCSRSITGSTYSHDVIFLKYLVNRLSISPSSVRLSVITFASNAKVEFNFEQFVNRECVLRKLRQITKSRRKGRTNIGAAIRKAVHLFKSYKGFAKNREIYLISDGKFNEGRYPKEDLKTLSGLGVKIHVFAVGRRPNEKNLKEIASSVNDYTRLRNDGKNFKEVVVKLTNKRDSYTKCKGRGAMVLDECGRECKCSNGVLRDCHRVRREFTTFTPEEKKRYLQAYFTITTVEPLKSRFVKFIRKHADYFWAGIHKTYQFFPWHRWYIYQFENLLREVDCRVTVPFWDWSYWNKEAWKVGIHIWRDDEYGFGGNGEKSKTYCVQTGPFNESAWSHPANEKIDAVLGSTYSVTNQCSRKFLADRYYKPCLRRSFNNRPPNLAHVLQTIAIPCLNFKEFDSFVRGGYHNDIHNEIGGEMSSDYAANAPEFFLHHAFLDNIWYRWQNKGSLCKFAYFPANVSALIHGPFDTIDFVDSSNQGHCVRVRYDDFIGRVVPQGTILDKPLSLEGPDCEQAESDAESEVGINRSPFTVLKEEMKRERDEETQAMAEGGG